MSSSSDNSNETLKVLYIASEAEPLVKVGGLGDVAGSLPHALRALAPTIAGGKQLDVRLVIPHHAAIRQKIDKPKPLKFFSIPYENSFIEALLSTTTVNKVPIYLIAGSPIPYEGPVYSGDPCIDGEKYAFFSLAALEMLKHIEWKPDIIQANDWHSALSVYALSQFRKNDSFYNNISSTLIIHNLPYMGGNCDKALNSFNIPRSNEQLLPDWARHLPLPLGMLTADIIITVSPTYANEILTPEFGCGLERFLQSRCETITGILNGIDIEDWDPSTDTATPYNYTIDHLEQRTVIKQELLAEFFPSYDPDPDSDQPLLIIISRMDHQKGIDLAIEGLIQISDLPWRIIILGTGDKTLENACRKFQDLYPDRVKATIRFDTKLAKRMYAAADMILIPSRYEPCGLAQMIAMRYGCIPVARSTGGLRDTIFDNRDTIQNNPALITSTGFLFEDKSAEGLSSALRRAIHTYQIPSIWKAMQKQCMQQDFTWNRSALAYAQIYLKLKGNS